MKEENGDLIEYEHEYSAVLETDKKCKKHGWREFNKDMRFLGLLDLNKLAIWYVDEKTLIQEK